MIIWPELKALSCGVSLLELIRDKISVDESMASLAIRRTGSARILESSH